MLLIVSISFFNRTVIGQTKTRENKEGNVYFRSLLFTLCFPDKIEHTELFSRCTGPNPGMTHMKYEQSTLNQTKLLTCQDGLLLL